MPIANSFIGSGLRHGYVKESDGTVHDIYGIMEVSADPEQDETEVKGDDTVLGTFASSRKENVTISANAFSFDAIQAMTGATGASSASGTELPIGTTAEQNAPFVEVGAVTNGKDDEGNLTYVMKVYHKLQVKSVKVNQANGTEFSIEAPAVAYYTTKDITGATLSPGRTSTVKHHLGQYE
jgi:hypothetical protein